nr:unnamed protein product [Callosobruchus analis]
MSENGVHSKKGLTSEKGSHLKQKSLIPKRVFSSVTSYRKVSKKIVTFLRGTYKKWKKIRKPASFNEEVFKVYLLEEESIRQLYQDRLNKILGSKETKQDINEEYHSITQAVKITASEVLGKKREFRKKKGLRIWSDEIEEAVKEEQRTYMHYLNNSAEANHEIYKQSRNVVKEITRRLNEESWDRFISNIENDIHGRQNLANKKIEAHKIVISLRSSPMPSLSWSSYVSSGLPETSHSSYDRCVMHA